MEHHGSDKTSEVDTFIAYTRYITRSFIFHFTRLLDNFNYFSMAHILFALADIVYE